MRFVVCMLGLIFTLISLTELVIPSSLWFRLINIVTLAWWGLFVKLSLPRHTLLVQPYEAMPENPDDASDATQDSESSLELTSHLDAAI